MTHASPAPGHLPERRDFASFRVRYDVVGGVVVVVVVASHSFRGTGIIFIVVIIIMPSYAPTTTPCARGEGFYDFLLPRFTHPRASPPPCEIDVPIRNVVTTVTITMIITIIVVIVTNGGGAAAVSYYDFECNLHNTYLCIELLS